MKNLIIEEHKMTSLKKGKGVAIASGGIYILIAIFSIIVIFLEYGMFQRGELTSLNIDTIGVLISILFSIIPTIIFGIMLIIGKLHYGLTVPPLLQGIGLLASGISSIIHYYKILGNYTGKIILIYNIFQMIPLILLFIVLILFNKHVKLENKDPLGIICFVPAICRTIVLIILFFESYDNWNNAMVILAGTSALLSVPALILLGVWIHVNTHDEQTVSTAAKQYGAQNSPQQGGNQQYYQQPYSAQYSPQYNPQTGVPQPVPGQQYYQQQYPQQAYPQQQYPQQQYYSAPGYQQPATPQQRSDASSEAEAIKTYKELLDNGMITQEEYELKKKQILGI